MGSRRQEQTPSPALCWDTPSASGTSPVGFCPLSGTHSLDLDHPLEDAAVPWPPAPGAQPERSRALLPASSVSSARGPEGHHHFPPPKLRTVHVVLT